MSEFVLPGCCCFEACVSSLYAVFCSYFYPYSVGGVCDSRALLRLLVVRTIFLLFFVTNFRSTAILNINSQSCSQHSVTRFRLSMANRLVEVNLTFDNTPPKVKDEKLALLFEGYVAAARTEFLSAHAAGVSIAASRRESSVSFRHSTGPSMGEAFPAHSLNFHAYFHQYVDLFT